AARGLVELDADFVVESHRQRFMPCRHAPEGLGQRVDIEVAFERHFTSFAERQAGARVIAAAQPLLRLGLGQWIATVPHRGPARFRVPPSSLPTTVPPRSHGRCRAGGARSQPGLIPPTWKPLKTGCACTRQRAATTPAEPRSRKARKVYFLFQ